MALNRSRIVAMVRKLAKALADDREPGSWPGLSKIPGRQPIRVGANLFLLGSIVDGGRQTAEEAWRRAQRFLMAVVPSARRETVWEWILEHHTTTSWERLGRKDRLHRNSWWHGQVFTIAKRMVTCFNGDPRNLWRDAPDDAVPIDYLRSALQIVGLGPARSRMVVGALKDRKLVRGASPFKDDLHVRRLMHRLGLAASENSQEVLRAGRALFGPDNWEVDKVFYLLGKKGIRTRTDFIAFYNRRLAAGSSRRRARQWRVASPVYTAVVDEAVEKLRGQVRPRGWDLSRGRDTHVPGFYLWPTDGPLKSWFWKDRMWVWNGVEVFPGENKVGLWSEIAWDITLPISQDVSLRDRLTGGGYGSGFEAPRTETFMRELASLRLTRNTTRQRSMIVASLVRGALDATHHLDRL